MNLVVKIELLWRRFKQCCLSRITQGALTLIVYKMSIMFPAHTAANTNLSAQALYDLQHGDVLTMAFATLGLIQLFHAFNVKSIYQSIFKLAYSATNHLTMGFLFRSCY